VNLKITEKLLPGEYGKNDGTRGMALSVGPGMIESE